LENCVGGAAAQPLVVAFFRFITCDEQTLGSKMGVDVCRREGLSTSTAQVQTSGELLG
jgi:hypothetical protein